MDLHAKNSAPKSISNASITHGKYAALNCRPNMNLTMPSGFLRAQYAMIIMIRDIPRIFMSSRYAGNYSRK